MPVVATASPFAPLDVNTLCIPILGATNIHGPRSHKEGRPPQQTKLTQQGPHGPENGVSPLHQQSTETAVKKERRKNPGDAGVCAGSPHSCVPEVLVVSPVPGLGLGGLWGPRGQAGEEARGKWWASRK